MMNGTCLLDENYSDLFLQPLWEQMRKRQSVFLSPSWSAFIALALHILVCLPYFALDIFSEVFHWNCIYKISDGPRVRKISNVWRWLRCLGRIIVKYLLGILPAIALFQRIRQMTFPERAPSCFIALAEVAQCLFFFDTLFYFWHFLMHRVPWLFHQVHRQHHQNYNTFALTAQDASVAELVSLQALAVVSAALVRCHPLSEALFHLLNIVLAVDDHCGWDLPWAHHHLLPFFSGARYHQAHHQRHKGNYAPYFRHWDWVFGTLLVDDTSKLQHQN